MRKRQTRQTLLSQAMRLKESDGREDIEDLARIKEDLGTGRQQLFLRCMVIATAILVLIGAVVALML